MERRHKQVPEIKRSSGVLVIKITKREVMTSMIACFVCGWKGKLANEGLSLALSPSSFEHLISRSLISGNNQSAPLPRCILPEHRAHVGILPHQPALCCTLWQAVEITHTHTLLCTNACASCYTIPHETS